MENQLNQVVDALLGLVWTALPDGRIDFLNQRWCEYTGLSVDEAYGQGWQAAIHPEDLPELLERWRSILAAREPGEMEARLRHFDGEYRWFLFRTCPLADASGQIVKWCGMSTDIEDRRRSEESRRARESRFQSIVDGLPAPCALMTPAGDLEFANRQALEYFGTTQRFQQSGHGDIINSWIGSGQNQPITPDQLHQALGPQAVDNLSRLTGVAAADLISELSRVLPGDR
jgi:PAS domain S-box-containing protein